jgi:hypothetical protein
MRVKSAVNRSVLPVNLPDSEKAQLGIVKLDVFAVYAKTPSRLLFRRPREVGILDSPPTGYITPNTSPQPNNGASRGRKRRGRPRGSSNVREFRNSGAFTPPYPEAKISGCIYLYVYAVRLIFSHLCAASKRRIIQFSNGRGTKCMPHIPAGHAHAVSQSQGYVAGVRQAIRIHQETRRPKDLPHRRQQNWAGLRVVHSARLDSRTSAHVRSPAVN